MRSLSNTKHVPTVDATGLRFHMGCPTCVARGTRSFRSEPEFPLSHMKPRVQRSCCSVSHRNSAPSGAVGHSKQGSARHHPSKHQGLRMPGRQTCFILSSPLPDISLPCMCVAALTASFFQVRSILSLMHVFNVSPLLLLGHCFRPCLL